MPQHSDIYLKPRAFCPKKGEYDPGQAFQVFLGCTDQKDRHHTFMDSLFSGLIETDVIRSNKIITFIDLACGDGQSSKNMLEILAKKTTSGVAVHYIGLDADPRFVSSGTDAMHDVKDVFKDIVKADIFQGGSLPVRQADNAIVYIGHALYYGGPQGENLGTLATNVEDVLGEHAICITAHNASDCELANIRSKVAKDVFPQPSGVFAAKAEESGMSCTEKKAEATLSFPKLTPLERQKLSEPDTWQEHKRPEFSEALRLISFVAQQALPAPSNVMLSSEQQLLPRLTREELNTVVNDIYGAEREREKPELKIISNYQIFAPKQRDVDLTEGAGLAITNAEPEANTYSAMRTYAGARGR